MDERVMHHFRRLLKVQVRKQKAEQLRAYHQAQGTDFRNLDSDKPTAMLSMQQVDKEGQEENHIRAGGQRVAEEQRRQEEEQHHKTEEADRLEGHHREVEAHRLEEEQRRAEEHKRQEEEQRYKAEEAHRLEEERRRAEEQKRQEEEQRQKAEEAHRLEEERRRAEEQKRQEEEQRQKAEEAHRLEEERRRAEEEKRREERCEAEETFKRDEHRKEAPRKCAEDRQGAYTSKRCTKVRFRPYPDTEKRDEAKKTAYSRYRMRWQKLRSSSQESTIPRRMWSFYDVPWPVHPIPTNPLELSKGHIKRFLLTPGSDNFRTKIKKELLQWHPDRFDSCVLPLIYEDEIPIVKQGLHIVSAALTALLNSGDNS